MANPSRVILEDSMLAAVHAAMPSARVESIPMRDLDARLAGVNGPTVYMIYGAGESGEPQGATLHVQDSAWQWSVFCLDRDYRGDQAAGSALALLEAVETALVGERMDAGGGHRPTVCRLRDELAQLPASVRGVCGYELVVYVETQFRK